MLVAAALKNNLVSLFNQMKQSEISEADFADKLAAIIDNYIKTATVTVNAGIPISSPSGAGVTTAPGNGSLS